MPLIHYKVFFRTVHPDRSMADRVHNWAVKMKSPWREILSL